MIVAPAGAGARPARRCWPGVGRAHYRGLGRQKTDSRRRSRASFDPAPCTAQLHRSSKWQ